MSIVRTVHNKENPYAQINKKALWDKDLSLEAVGLWARLLSRPDDWRVSVTELSKSCGCSVKKIYRILNELVDHGYACRFQAKEEEGKFAPFETIVFETKKPKQQIEKMFPLTQKRLSGKPLSANRATTKTNLPKTEKTTTTEPPEIPKKEPQKKSSSSSFPIFDCLRDLPIPERKKQELSRDFSEEKVKNALEYAKTHPIKKSLLATLFWHCREDVGAPMQISDIAKEMAYNHNEIYKEHSPEVYEENLKLIPQGKMLIWESKGFDQIVVKAPKKGEDNSQLKEDLDKSKNQFKKETHL